MTAEDIIAALCEVRGITDLARFSVPDYAQGRHDPFLLNDMDRAVERIAAAIRNGERIAIYGDYDIDGLTASTLLLDAFRSWGSEARAYIPDRFKEGYGISLRGLEQLHAEGTDLIVTVDCGSRSHKEIAWAKAHGMDVVVTDHHSVEETLPPDASAVVNPKRLDNTYPFADLAGVGVAFKLVQALQTRLKGLEDGHEKWLMDLVALGTVCDVVTLVDENRCSVYWGLKVLEKTRRPGLRALMEVSGVRPEQGVNAEHLGFQLGPRLNASGRMEHAKRALELLTAPTMEEARPIAEELNELNVRRRADQAFILKEAMEQAERLDDPVLVLRGRGWSHGIVGIVAANLMERLGKPAVVMEWLDDKTKGSARSFGDFHLADALLTVRHLTTTAGGHAYAAGATLPNENFDDFVRAINDYYRSQDYPDQSVHLRPRTDLEVGDFGAMDLRLHELLKQLAPFGRGNEEPQFRLPRATVVQARTVGAEGQHVQLTLRCPRGEIRRSIGFKMSHLEGATPGEEVSVWFRLGRNDYMGRSEPQLMLAHFEPAP